MVSKSLDYEDTNTISRELKLAFGLDMLGYRIVCNDNLIETGEYYLFVQCRNYSEHLESVNQNRYITGVVPSRASPHVFSDIEVEEFEKSVGKKEVVVGGFKNGDVVLVTEGYLKGLYGIVVKELSSKKVKVFFSFYVRQFYENFNVTCLEFIGKVNGYEFPSEVIGKPLVIGAHVVHHRKLHRPTG
jgi:hypothetical protein